MALMTSNGLDLNFKETKANLGMPVRGSKHRFAPDPIMEGIGRSFSNIDMQQYLTRFKWNNLPEGMDSELFEKIMYFSGSAMFFYIKDLDKFFFLPYGMSGQGEDVGIDFYGRFKKIKPYSFNGATQDSKKRTSADVYLSTQIRENIVDIPMVKTEAEAKKIYEEGAVICWDNSPGLAYWNESRNRTAQPYIKYMVKVLIQTKSALINASGFNLFASDGEQDNDLMQMQIDAINEDRENGKLAAVVSKLLGNIENIQSNAPAAIQDFYAALQSADNLRLKSMGISNDGMQQKSQYQNMQSQQMDISDSMQVYWNCFMERIKFAAIVNSIWGLSIYPEPLLLGVVNGDDLSEGEDTEGGDNKQAKGGTNDGSNA